MREIRLYDSTSGEMATVRRGDAIRIEVRRTPASDDGAVHVDSSRSFVLFGLLQRFLEWEGFPTTFLFDSPSGEDVMYQLSNDASDEDAGDIDVDVDVEQSEMQLAEIQLADVDRWVDIRFGAARDGDDLNAKDADERISLSLALEHFGAHAVTLYLLSTHYSEPLGDTFEGLLGGMGHIERIRTLLKLLLPGLPSPLDMRHHVESFRDALASDLDTPRALVALFAWLHEAEGRGGGVGDEDLRKMLEMFELHDLALPSGAA